MVAFIVFMLFICGLSAFVDFVRLGLGDYYPNTRVERAGGAVVSALLNLAIVIWGLVLIFK